MLPFAVSWQEMIGSLPPAEQAELAALIAGQPGERAEDDDT